MKNLKVLRKEHGWRQQDVAEAAGIVASRYAYYERPGIMPPTKFLPKLAMCYGITVEELMGWDDVVKRAEHSKKNSPELSKHKVTVKLDGIIKHEHKSNAWTCPNCKSRNLLSKSRLDKYAEYRQKGGDNDWIDVYCQHCLKRSIVVLGADTVYYVKEVEA